MDVAQTSSPQPHTEQNSNGWSISRGGCADVDDRCDANGLCFRRQWIEFGIPFGADELYSLTNMGVFDPALQPTADCHIDHNL